MRLIQIADKVISLLFIICYAYQLVYIPIALHRHKTAPLPITEHRFAILIAARNEESVIAQLIDSIKAQHYPSRLIDIYVVADNCTDNTAKVAAENGATVFCRFNKTYIGKGYALKFLLDNIDKNFKLSTYDAFMIFDADNLLDENYVSEMNKMVSQGHRIITSYRNTKNYGDNWISAGHGLWFARESQYLNRPRFNLDSSCAVSGTGYLFCYDVLKKYGGWHFFLLTEDIEFTMHSIVNGEKVAYCESACFYDEQPTRFMVSFRQRMRWSRGTLQVFHRYGRQVIAGMFKGSFACFDMLSNNMAAYLLAIAGTALNIITIAYNLIYSKDMSTVLMPLLKAFYFGYATMWSMALITTISEWSKLTTSTFKKIFYMFTFPLYMMTNLPIAICALFMKVKWTPIEHNKSISIAELHKQTSLINISAVNTDSSNSD